MRAWLAVPLIGVLVAACPSDDSGGGEDDETTAVDGTPVATALCEYLVRCEPQLGRLTGSVQECVDLQIAIANNCEPFAFNNTQAEVDACVAWLDAEACDWSTREPRSPYYSGPCSVLHSDNEETQPESGPGEDCSDTDACVEGYNCDRAVPAGTCIICVAKGEAGAPCHADLQCQDALFCDTVASECTAPRADGGNCSYISHCTSSYCITGKCGQPLERGDPCTAGDICRGNLACMSGFCTDRLGQDGICATHADCLPAFICQQDTCQRVARCGSGVVGDVCSDSNDCGAGLYCDGESNVCATQLAQDADCVGNEGECGPTNICRSDHTCQPPGETGAECGAASDCVDGLYCGFSELQCVPLEPNGNECVWDPMCASGHCDSSGSPQVCADEPACTMP